MSDAGLTAMARQTMPFAALLGLEIVSGDASEVVGRAEWQPERCTVSGALHGGYLMAIADSVGAMCAFFNLPEAAGTATIESKTNLFRPVTEGAVEVRATPVHAGRSVIVVQTDVVRADGKLASRTTQSQAVLGS